MRGLGAWGLGLGVFKFGLDMDESAKKKLHVIIAGSILSMVKSEAGHFQYKLVAVLRSEAVSTVGVTSKSTCYPNFSLSSYLFSQDPRCFW